MPLNKETKLYQVFGWLKNDIQHKCWLHKIIIQLQIRLNIILFFKLEHLKCIAQVKIFL